MIDNEGIEYVDTYDLMLSDPILAIAVTKVRLQQLREAVELQERKKRAEVYLNPERATAPAENFLGKIVDDLFARNEGVFKTSEPSDQLTQSELRAKRERGKSHTWRAYKARAQLEDNQ